MSQPKHINWLREQLPSWVEQKIIDQAQSELLLQQYPQSERNLARAVFTSIGALIFGLGVILFFAYNWDDMHRWLKLAIIFSGIILSHLGAQYFVRDPQNQNLAVSEGLAFLGTMLFGAGIWLVSQIYHIDEHFPNGIAAWGIGALMIAWARQSWLQAFVALSLIGSWAQLDILSFGIENNIAPWIILLGVVPLAWRLRSRFLLFVSICSCFYFWMLYLGPYVDETVLFAVAAIATVLISLGNLLSRNRAIDFPSIRYVVGIPGYAVYLFSLFVATFAYTENKPLTPLPLDSSMQIGVYWTSLIIAVGFILLMLLAKKWPAGGDLGKLKRTDLGHAALILSTLFLIFSVLPGYLQLSYTFISTLANLFIVSHCILFILNGSRDQRPWEVTLGCVVLVILVFTRYTDLFDSLLARAALFLGLGAGLFLVGGFYSSQKKSETSALGVASNE